MHPAFFDDIPAELREALIKGDYGAALHEIGHVLGVGTGKHWRANMVKLDSLSNVMTDPRSVAAFNKHGGDRWTGPKVLLIGPHGWHWEWCLASQDIMSGSEWYVPDPYGDVLRPDLQAARAEQPYITELTAASLRPGYRYDPSTLRPAQFGLPLTDSDRQRCLDGRLKGKGSMS